MPLSSHAGQPLAVADSVNQPLTLAEVEVGLQKLRNGRSAAMLGYTSELLRNAKLSATPESPAPPHLPASADAAFSTGQVPQPWKSSLVNPICKKGDTTAATDTANYRLIAVGEPISRLHVNMLAQRLVSSTEQRLLTQTGYRPELGTIHQAFALKHVIDKHRYAKQPLYLCFFDLKSALTGSSGLYCGVCFRGWGYNVICWGLFNPCTMAACRL